MTAQRHTMSAGMLALGCAAALALGPPAAQAAEPVLPLSQVSPGMTGEIVTAVEGNELVTFNFEVIEVAGQGQGPVPEVILFRATGELLERTGGLAEGMSGSPLYVTGKDGVRRVVGALAFGTGDEANLIGGATPIEAMLRAGIPIEEPRTANARPRAFRHRILTAPSRSAARRLQQRRPNAHVLHPLVRWTASGWRNRLKGNLTATLRRADLADPVVIPGRTLPPVDSPLAPGTPMSMQLVSGDLALGGLGTVTYVDGEKLWGVGHPVLGIGETEAMLGDGKVIAMIPAPITGSSYKLGDLGRVRGKVTGDYSTGLTATIGEETGIPFTANAHYRATGARVNLNLRLAPDERLAPALADLIQREAVTRVRDAQAPGTVYLRMKITSPLWKKPIVSRGRFIASTDVTQDIDPVLGSHLAALMQTDVKKVPISSIRIDQTISKGIRSGEIIGVGVTPRVLTRGQKATLVVRVRPYRGRPRSYKVGFRVPRKAALGRREITITPNASPDSFGGGLSGPDIVPGLLGSGRVPSQISRRMKAALAAVEGDDDARIREALSDTMLPRSDAVRLEFPRSKGEPVSKTAVIPVVITDGEASTSVVIRPARR